MKTCTGCKITKPITEFHKKQSQCKDCRAVLRRQYYKKYDRNKARESQRKYYRNHPALKTWEHMMQRCHRGGTKSSKYYMRKGIKVQKSWHSFPVFEKYALQNGFFDGCQVHRIDNDCDYEEGNILFLTEKTHRELHKQLRKTK